MPNSDLLRGVISRIIKYKSTGEKYVFTENAKFFEEILGKRITSEFIFIVVNRVSEEDITTLQECLDYIYIIED